MEMVGGAKQTGTPPSFAVMGHQFASRDVVQFAVARISA
jgi:hypothetical protein